MRIVEGVTAAILCAAAYYSYELWAYQPTAEDSVANRDSVEYAWPGPLDERATWQLVGKEAVHAVTLKEQAFGGLPAEQSDDAVLALELAAASAVILGADQLWLRKQWREQAEPAMDDIKDEMDWKTY